jgi:hypothetical protein
VLNSPPIFACSGVRFMFEVIATRYSNLLT